MAPNEHLDLFCIPDADAEEILKIAKQEARRALGRGADSMLKEHLESEGVLAACKAYCVWPGGIYIRLRTSSGPKQNTDELRSESNSDAIRGYGADALNRRRKDLHLGTETITASLDGLIARGEKFGQIAPNAYKELDMIAQELPASRMSYNKQKSSQSYKATATPRPRYTLAY